MYILKRRIILIIKIIIIRTIIPIKRKAAPHKHLIIADKLEVQQI